jgi:hypothetical protein
MTLKSLKETWVNCGLPAHSPIAQTLGALVFRRSLTVASRVQFDTGHIEPDPGGVGTAPCRNQYVAPFDGLLA